MTKAQMTTAMTKAMIALAVAMAAAVKCQAQEMEIKRRAVINIPAMTLELFENGELVTRYPVAVGKRSTPTPTGAFLVTTHVKNPTWYGPNGEVIKAGAGNPVGTRWMGLDKKGYGIHGTNAPKSIGRASSHGCVRMKNSDVEELFARMRVGDEVEIVYETTTADGMALKDVYGLQAKTASAEQAKPASVGGGI